MFTLNHTVVMAMNILYDLDIKTYIIEDNINQCISNCSLFTP